MSATEQVETKTDGGKSGSGVKLVVLLVIIAAGFVTFQYTSLGDYVQPERLKAFFDSIAGFWWAPLAYMGTYAVGTVVGAPGLVLTSPYVRTRQTTEVMLESLGAPCETIVTQNLTPDASVIDLWSEMREYGQLGPLVLVGHNPLLSELVSVMIGSPRFAVEMKKAALAYVSGVGYGSQPQGRLVWLLTAKLAGV